ncbi:hypothetical protein TPA0598_08_01050 [Streptomyces lydicamycinicus]|uniref:Uncharacterized protein n=1 Tax=Streptomyces lydicamycinicus TaxID=1546107 RepID=A0A0P4RDC1_9ACTN|nr:hypothetical protein TPA0598_08_01050 [Streptomyces lydicamycinicus]
MPGDWLLRRRPQGFSAVRYHSLVFPLLLGAGKRLFSARARAKETQKLTLVEHEAYANGLRKNVFDVVR